MHAALPSLLNAPVVPPTISFRAEKPSDEAAREALLDLAMGANRRRKSSEAIRRGRLPAAGLSLVAETSDRGIVGTVRLWNVSAGLRGGRDVDALLLGPLAVDPALEGSGIGSALMRQAIARSRQFGHGAIVLVGDAPYYGRFGFSADAAAALAMPGPFERHRLLALPLRDDALDGASGLVRPTGRFVRSKELPVNTESAFTFGQRVLEKAGAHPVNMSSPDGL